MKTLILSAVLAMSVSTASADGLQFYGDDNVTPASQSSWLPGVAFVGDVNYAFEAERFESTIGVEVEIVDNLTVTPSAEFSYAADTFTFEGTNVRADYYMSSNVTVYGTVDFDPDFKYEEVTVGVGLRF